MGPSPTAAGLPVKRARLSEPAVSPGEVQLPKVSSTSPVFVVVSPPWDLLRGRCVFKHANQLEDEVSSSSASHCAPNCATFSRAREIPIKGIKCPPRPVRSELFPKGIPSELERMSAKSRKRLRDDSTMADLSAESCLRAHKAQKIFSLEHPGRSLALRLPSWQELMRQ